MRRSVEASCSQHLKLMNRVGAVDEWMDVPAPCLGAVPPHTTHLPHERDGLHGGSLGETSFTSWGR